MSLVCAGGNENVNYFVVHQQAASGDRDYGRRVLGRRVRLQRIAGPAFPGFDTDQDSLSLDFRRWFLLDVKAGCGDEEG